MYGIISKIVLKSSTMNGRKMEGFGLSNLDAIDIPKISLDNLSIVKATFIRTHYVMSQRRKPAVGQKQVSGV